MKLLNLLKETLKQDQDLISDEGKLKKWVAIGKVRNFDEQLIGILLEEPKLKAAFFKEIKGHLIFNSELFLIFLEQKEFIKDNYTEYKNKIGLNINGKSLKERNEVSLVWPFKDCILEGGQTREEKGRDEIFFNQILAQDEITQLLEPKVITNAKRYTIDGEQDLTTFNRDEHGNITDNLIIKGNNLLALHSLKKQFRGKVKLIYIDPPYNTESDSFKYNDRFNHASWLTFIQNRLIISKELLRNDGGIFIQCDDKEHAYLKILCDEIFGRDNFVNDISVQMSESSGTKMAHTSFKLPKIKEHILCYRKSEQLKFNSIKIPKENWDNEYNKYLENFERFDSERLNEIIDFIKNENLSKDKLKSLEAELDNIFSKVEMTNVSNKFQELGIFEKEEQLAWLYENSYRIVRTAASNSAKRLTDKKKERNKNLFFVVLSSRDKIPYVVKSDYSTTSTKPRVQLLFASDYLTISICDLWTDIKTTGLEPEGNVTFKNGKKPEELLKRIIDLATNSNDLILDFFAGSGTTASVAHKMNRQYITIEQLDYFETVTLERVKNTLHGRTNGISKSVNWQGGGEFVYFELKKYNEAFIEQIQAATTKVELSQIWEAMKERSFLDYNLDLKMQEAQSEAFGKLDLETQQKALIELLDKNQLYVNVSNIEDAEMQVTATEKTVTNDFYELNK